MDKLTISDSSRADCKIVRGVSLPYGLNERALNAAVALDMRISHIAEAAIGEWLARAEGQNGGPFPQRCSALPIGRPRSR